MGEMRRGDNGRVGVYAALFIIIAVSLYSMDSRQRQVDLRLGGVEAERRPSPLAEQPESSSGRSAAVDAPFAELSNKVDGYLQIPTVVRRVNAHLLKPYTRLQKGLRVRYRGNMFSPEQPDLVWVPEVTKDRYKLRWETLGKKIPGAGLVGVFPGNVLRILDDDLYDFGVGTLFVRVYHEASRKTGFTLYETIIGDCDPADDQLWAADDIARLKKRTMIEIDDLTVYQISQPRDMRLVDKWIDILGDPTRYRTELNGGIEGAGVHPVYAANVATSVLFELFQRKHPEPRREEILWAVRRFFDRWVIPNAVPMAEGTVSWPYHFPWKINWGITLEPPWYSAYANARMAMNAAVLYRLTDQQSYLELARKSAKYLSVSIDKGGAQYDILGFKLPAEYVYPSPPMPNVRVLDGELIVVASLFNVARLTGDSDLLRIFMTQAGSLAMQLESYQRPDGDLEFSMYIEDLPQHYRWDVWSALQILGNETKDRRFTRVARAFAKHIPQEWKDSEGS